MQDSFSTSFVVTQSPEAAYAAIINPRAWWTGDYEGTTNAVGESFTYRYKDLHRSRQLVTELYAGRRVVWQVVDADLSFIADRTEWTGTTIIFDIARGAAGTQVTFTHVGLRPNVECFETCTDAWTTLIHGSLRHLIETGTSELPELDAPRTAMA